MSDSSASTLSALEGVIAAVPTPITEAGAPDIDRFLTQCRWALENGCNGLNILGTTGEANSFGREARITIMTAAAKAFDSKRLMVGTGLPDAEGTIALTKMAYALGYGAALVLPPFYYKSVSDDGLFSYFEKLVNATKETPIPLFLYNFPALTGVPYSESLIVRLVGELGGRVRGIKDSSGDIPYCQRLAKALPGFMVYPSSETALTMAKEDGFAGCISASVNITAPRAGKIWNSSDADERAREGAKIAAERAAISAEPLIPAIKFLIASRYNDPAWEALLPPLMPLTEGEKKRLLTALQ
ncbi:MAG: dihydrodipicolinate synthase family protein [Alphaproteobacteria bacterium]|nr:MAG: dihydrodipicolinate synthase family protein [Alphaproteobacteria bacterium]